MGRKLSKGIIIIFIANVINLLFNLIGNFVLPKYLSYDTYAYIKTFTLYVSYAGFLHLGYEDGMYLKYGGTDKDDLDGRELDANVSTLRIFQIIVAFAIVIGGLIAKDLVVVIFGLTILPYNMTYYYKNLYQAIGEFKQYSRVQNAISICIFALQMGLLFIAKEEDYPGYLVVYVIVYLGIWLTLEIKTRKLFPAVKFHWFSFSKSEFITNIKSGFFLMLGNFSSILLMSMDRLFVKTLMDNVAFAQYSFAVSTESFLNVAITPISVTLYNYFCKVKETEKINKVKRYVLIFAVFVTSAAYWGDFILDLWLPKYKASSATIFYLFCAQMTFIVITSIYVNLYKARKQQKIYFIKLAIVIVAGFLLNLFAFLILHTKESFALATLLSGFLWILLCQFDLPDAKLDFQEWIYLIVLTVAFMVIGIEVGSLIGWCMYMALALALSILLFKREFFELIKVLMEMVTKRRKAE